MNAFPILSQKVLRLYVIRASSCEEIHMVKTISQKLRVRMFSIQYVSWIDLWSKFLTDNPKWRYVYTIVFGDISEMGFSHVSEVKRRSNIPSRTVEYILRRLKDRQLVQEGRKGFGGPWLLYPTPEFQYVITKWWESFRRKKI